ncbi:hypothetical protein FRB99_005577 [Tulasnella sp. 403]|nr:hypothetical protein FRB99_005577 [Tulasnella sp. 403]
MPSATTFSASQPQQDPSKSVPNGVRPSPPTSVDNQPSTSQFPSSPPPGFTYYQPHQVVDHPTDGSPVHDQDNEEQHRQSHPALPAELLAAAAAGQIPNPAFPAPTGPTSSPPGTIPQPLPQSIPQPPMAPGQLPVPFPPPGTVPVAYFAGPGGSIIAIPQLKSKRRQVKNACTNCQKACKKCDEVRPCGRCVKYGIDKDCVDSQRKERKKGIKRGPYKKREPKPHEEEDPGQSSNQAVASLTGAAHILSPENAAALQAMAGGAVIYSYGPTAPNGTPTILAAAPTQQGIQHIAHLPGLQPVKGPDGNYTYPQQYYAIAPPGMPSQEPPTDGAEGSGSQQSQQSQQPPQQQQQTAQPHPPTYPVPYYPQMAYTPAYPAATAGYIIQQAGPGQPPTNPIYQLPPSGITPAHHNDDPIERQKQPAPTFVDSHVATTSKGKGKSDTKPDSKKAGVGPDLTDAQAVVQGVE